MCAAYVYITANKRSGTLYIGSTTNLIQRIWQHKNKSIDSFTAKYNVDQLVYFEVHANILSTKNPFSPCGRRWPKAG
jgi:putative endonuclease